jgi:hypothetical protein
MDAANAVRIVQFIYFILAAGQDLGSEGQEKDACFRVPVAPALDTLVAAK